LFRGTRKKHERRKSITNISLLLVQKKRMLIREEEWKSQARRYDNQLNFSVQKVSLNYDFSMSFFRCTRKANELLNQRMYFMKLTPHYYQTIFLFPLPSCATHTCSQFSKHSCAQFVYGIRKLFFLSLSVSLCWSAE
jgi:hypothetical protein